MSIGGYRPGFIINFNVLFFKTVIRELSFKDFNISQVVED
jgi:hypothetical protein